MAGSHGTVGVYFVPSYNVISLLVVDSMQRCSESAHAAYCWCEVFQCLASKMVRIWRRLAMAPIALTTLGMLCAACADVMSMLVMVTSSGISCRLSNLVVIVWFRNVSVSSSVDATGVLLNSFTIHRRTFSPRLHELRTSAHCILCRVDTQDEYEIPYSSTPSSFAKSRSTQAHTE